MTAIVLAYLVAAALAWWFAGAAGVTTLATVTVLVALAIMLLAQATVWAEDRRQRRIGLERLAEWERERR